MVHAPLDGTQPRAFNPASGNASCATHRVTVHQGPSRVSQPDQSKPWDTQRLFDLLVSCMLLLLGVPLFAAIIVLGKLTSRGPVFYSQERVGRGGSTFHILKFRSMNVDAEQATGPVFASANDSRSTPFGAWLRRTCLDELPQLVNVLRGEMSLVGPRPERPFFVNRFRLQYPDYDRRHDVRPGITGWAQIRGWRGNTSISRRLQCDLDYVRRRTLLVDLAVLLLTPLAVVWPRRAAQIAEGWSLRSMWGSRSDVESVFGERTSFDPQYQGRSAA